MKTPEMIVAGVGILFTLLSFFGGIYLIWSFLKERKQEREEKEMKIIENG